MSSAASAPARPRHRPRAGARTAFVLPGGASLGASQAGMLEALYELGISADLLVGTSAGALNAAFAASRPQTVSTARRLAEVWRGLRRDDIFPVSPRVVFGGLTNHRDHLIPDSGLRRLIQRHLQVDRLQDASIELHLVSFDLLAGEELRLSDGSALEAVLAATAIPGVLPAVRSGERLLVDGGVANNIPISHALELGAERIYVLQTYDPLARSLPAPPVGALEAGVHAFTLMLASRDGAELARHANAAELIVLPAVRTHRVEPTDFGHAEQLIHDGLMGAREVLASQPATSVSRARRGE